MEAQKTVDVMKMQRLKDDWERILSETDTLACYHKDVREWLKFGTIDEFRTFYVKSDGAGDYVLENSCLVVPAEIIEEA